MSRRNLFPLNPKRATWLDTGGNALRVATGPPGWRCATHAASLLSFGMSWHQADGISASWSVDATVSAARSASPTGFSAAILIESASGISWGLARMATICRCFGTLFDIRVRGCIGSTSSIKEAAAPGASPNGWFWRRHDLRACCEHTNTRLAGRSMPRHKLASAPASLAAEITGIESLKTCPLRERSTGGLPARTTSTAADGAQLCGAGRDAARGRGGCALLAAGAHGGFW